MGSVVLLVALLAVGTMAWFTSEDKVTNTFTAGTVKIKVNENGFEDLKNVNPGDTHEKKVTIKSLGSKDTYIRVKLTPKWVDSKGKEIKHTEGIAKYGIGEGWVRDKGWYYYKSIMNKGETTPLIEKVKFAGKNMGNRYQGATFTLKVEAQAVQASHYAFRDEWKINKLPWGVDKWEE